MTLGLRVDLGHIVFHLNDFRMTGWPVQTDL